MRHHHSPDASTFPRFKKMCFICIICFWKDKTAQAFNWDTYSCIALCLHLMQSGLHTCMYCYEAERSNLKLKTRSKQLIGYLTLYIALANTSLQSLIYTNAKFALS
jgi:hypothetical protein